MSNRSILFGALLVTALLAVATACSRTLQTTSAPDRSVQQRIQTMKPSITYVYLLRHTPFFTALNTSQLRWVVEHSREWEVEAGQVIVSSQSPGTSAGYWVLLDGGWDLTYRGRTHASGHADPGKWFNQDRFDRQAFELVANDHSYVMQISTQDMDDMLAKGFSFQSHLDAGKTLYGELVSSPATSSINQPTP
jgi:hypothetical protein